MGLRSTNPGSENSYQAEYCEIFDGRVVAVVRSNRNLGEIRVKIQIEGLDEKEFIFYS